MSNRILVCFGAAVCGAIGWLAFERGAADLKADSARTARSAVSLAATAAEAPAGPQFRLKTAAVGTGWEAIRYNVTTGETARSLALKFQKLAETGPIPSGDYELQIIPLGPDGFSGFGAVRFDRVSGRTWALVDNKWQEIP